MRRILAFEADKDLAAELRASLWRYGCLLDVLEDGDAGIEKALAERPDLILLSIELPRTNGFSICNRLKRNKTLKEIPLIITSSECSDETFEQHRTMQTRAEDYLRKPFEFSELLDKIRGLISLDTPISPSKDTAPGGSSDMEPAPLTDIFSALDGAFDSIRDKPPAPAKASPSPPPPRQHCLVVLWSPDEALRGQSYGFATNVDGLLLDEVARHELTVGRSPDNTIVIDDPMVSRAHFSLKLKDKAVHLRDLDSGGGTYVSDEQVSRAELTGGEVVHIGETSMLYFADAQVDEQLERIVRELSEIDPITRTLSYRTLRKRLEGEIGTAAGELSSLSVAAVTVDDLRQIAYRYGDLVAQRILREIAATLRFTGDEIVVGRDLGEGFLVILPETSEKVALGYAEGWRFEASVSEVIVGHHSVKPTISASVVQWREDWGITDFLRRVYKCLFEAQASGGNRVVTRSPAVDTQLPRTTDDE